MQTLTASAGSFASAEAQAVSTLGSIFAAPAITPVPATGNPTFTGALSLLTRIEEAVLLPPIKAFFDYLLQQEASPKSRRSALYWPTAKLTTGFCSLRTGCTTGRRSTRNSVPEDALLGERSAIRELCSVTAPEPLPEDPPFWLRWVSCLTVNPTSW